MGAWAILAFCIVAEVSATSLLTRSEGFARPVYGLHAFLLASSAHQVGQGWRPTAASKIKEHMEVIGADGVHLGTVDRVENGRIKLTKAGSGEGRHKGHHHSST